MIEILRLTDQATDHERAAFLERFTDCGVRLRRDPYGHFTAAPDYTALAIDLFGDRPCDLFIATESGVERARAGVVACATRLGAAVLGLYEATEGENGDAATALVHEAALRWASRHRVQELFAPVDASTWLGYRFRLTNPPIEISGRSYKWEPTHPPEYLTRFRRLGFEEAERYETRGFEFPVEGAYTVRDVMGYTAPALERARAEGFGFSGMKDVSGGVPYGELHGLCSEAFSDNLLYEPLSKEAFCSLYATALGASAEDFTYWVRDPAGRLSAVVFAFIDGDEVVIKSLAVHPSHRGRKLSNALVHLVLAAAHRRGRTKIVSALVRKGNTSEFLGLPHLVPGVETWTHQYVLLRRGIGQ